ncbi:translin family protein [Thermofilum pendens]|nr:haloacid dehalogenase [Thermofilum pendens]
MEEYSEKMKAELALIAKELDELDAQREKMLVVTREITRRAREAIFALHHGDLGKAGTELERARELIKELYELKQTHPQLYYSGGVLNAQTEYVEASLLASLLAGEGLPGFEELLVEPQAYLAGLGDLVGELRRYVLNILREGMVDKAWSILEFMEEIYVELGKFSYPEALVPGLRHKVDVARVILENTRNDVLFFERSRDLAQRIERLLEAMKGR